MAAPSDVTLSRESAFRGGRAPVPEPLLFRVLTSDRLLAAPSRHRLGDIDRVVIGRGVRGGASGAGRRRGAGPAGCPVGRVRPGGVGARGYEGVEVKAIFEKY